MTQDDLSARIAELERRDAELLQFQLAVAASGQKEDARFLALYSIVLEIAMELGVSGSDFQEHHEKRFNWFYEQELLRIGDKSPRFAAFIDARLPGAEPIEGCPPPLFPKKEG